MVTNDIKSAQQILHKKITFGTNVILKNNQNCLLYIGTE